MTNIRRKDIQQLALNLCDCITQMLSDMALKDSTIQRQAEDIKRLKTELKEARRG